MIADITFGENTMTIYINIAILKDQRIDSSPSRMDEVGPLAKERIKGRLREGYWDLLVFPRYDKDKKFELPILMIQVNRSKINNIDNYDILVKYLKIS
ncbi:MAG: hypothetical protein KKA07_05105 [Bacteroidetes bacterium]|nr:hypothetical protein [Bacteroidota bacterium]